VEEKHEYDEVLGEGGEENNGEGEIQGGAHGSGQTHHEEFLHPNLIHEEDDKATVYRKS